MQGCDGLIVISPGAVALMGTAGLSLAAAISALFYQVIKGRDNHIQYTQAVNADLTETNQILTGTTAGAIETVRKQRATSPRGTR